MRSNFLKTLKTAVLAVGVLLLGVGASVAQSVNMTAGPSSVTLPDGSTVQMWGYSCTAVAPATCTALNPNAGTGWSPVVITVPPGNLTINLTNNLPASVPETSLVIVGQLGVGQGKTASSTASPMHSPQGLTWPAADATTTNTPPPQGSRVQSFMNPVGPGATVGLTWNGLKEGTYLIESGTHPSIQGPMGLYGILVVTTAPSGATRGKAYSTPLVNYDSEIPALFSEIDPLQNNTVSAAVNTAGFSETKVWSGQPGGCGNPGSGAEYLTCYPPAVNYSPRYYLINGVAFDKTKVSASLFSPAPVATSGTMLVRMVNAGLRMHVPSMVGSLTGTPATPGFALIAEDGNPLPGVTRVQNEVFLAAGKTYDVAINVPAGTAALPIYDRSLGLSANATARDAGMLAYIGPSAATLPVTNVAAAATGETYYCVAGTTLNLSDPSRGVLANDTGANGVILQGNPANHTVTPFGSGAATDSLTLNPDGTFTYTQSSANTTCGGSFTYLVNGSVTATAAITQCDANSNVAACQLGGAPTANADTYTSHVSPSATATSARIQIAPPGVLSNDTDPQGHPLKAVLGGSCSGPGTALSSGVTLNDDGSFSATVSAAGQYHFCYNAVNSQKTSSATAAAVTLNFPAASNLAVTLIDGVTKAALPGSPQDYRWIIEEDRTVYIDPNCQTNPLPAGCPAVTGSGAPINFGTNFHTSYMPVVAQGCQGDISCETGQSVLGTPSVCDVGNGVCRPGATKPALSPSQVVLDPSKRYYISVLPGDAMDPGHQMGGAQIVYNTTSLSWQPVNIIVEPMPLPAAKLSVFVFEDDHPLNGEHDAGGGVDTLSPNEPGLGGFNITIFDLVGGTGDSAGQLTYDEFGQPLSNALSGTIDPLTSQDACPISKDALVGFDNSDGGSGQRDGVSTTGITGVIPVCPNYEADGTTLSPLGGQAVVANLPPGRYGIVATPGADRIARGEEWLQTNTLDGGKDLESFLRVNEPSYFQEFGPAGYHVSMGFANPQWINDFGRALCTGAGAPACTFSVTGMVTGVHMSRPADERLYGTGTRDTFGYTQCYVSLGSPDGGDISFTKCADDGSFTLTGIPAGDWRITIFDQWNDQIVDGITTPVRVGTGAGNTHCANSVCNMGEVSAHAWKNNLYTRTFIDLNGDGVSQPDEPGLALVPTNIRYRDGSISNLNSTDLQGYAGFNEVFPLFNWYVMETDSTRYKNTGTHVVNDAGGPVDGSAACGTNGFPACGTSSLLPNLARTSEDFSLPTSPLNLRFPGSVYCADADCSAQTLLTNPAGGGPGGSTGRIDPPWVLSYGWQSFAGQNQYLEFGKRPFAAATTTAPAENGGIHGHVVYASTRPFDDPALLLQLTWEPMVPHVTINLYKVGTAPDGSRSLTMVDTTLTSSWDDWAQGFRSDGVPNMNCPGQDPNGMFMYTLSGQPQFLDWYNSQHGGPAAKTLPNSSQFKCYDGMHNWNQLQPAPYDGMYQFPSTVDRNPTTGAPAGSGATNGTPGAMVGTNCTICVANPVDGTPMLPSGKYVVEMIVPPGYELVKEEDKNILLGDTYDAPVTQQFPGFGNIFIMPDQASVAASYNPNNPLIPTTDLGVTPRHEGDTGSVETFWPCVGTMRVVPDFNSLFPQAGQNAPFAGATRPLCDRKEVILEDQMSVLAKFYVFTSTHVAGHFTGIITDDFTSEFDPFSPHFGEKFSPANLPVAVKDWAGNEISRVYSDQWGIYNGLNYSSFSVNPPDPSGYIPNMMVMCMNDRGSAVAIDPLYQASYSQFCYELPFMPGQTGYFDTPVIPTTGFAEGYNHPDCAYPDFTPAIAEVDGDGVGPWVSAAGHTLTIHALGDQSVNNYGYSGPQASSAPWNQKTITRHYGFGSRCTSVGGACTAISSVTIGGQNATITGWSDTQITVNVPTISPTQSSCQIAQRTSPTSIGNSARCGQLIITAGNGKKSIDTVTVTIAGSTPKRVLAGQSIQAAIDAAAPGDLIIVSPGTYSELLLMWKPVRLQGVGAASSIIDANAHPAGKLNDWRTRVVCLFGLGTDGVHDSWNSTCGSSWTGWTATTSNPQVDRLPLEATVGWTATLNGNLAEQLQEPTLMGAYEGAGITVLSKGVRFPNNNTEFDADTFPANTTLLTGTNANNTNCNAFASDFYCNPSRIDGLTVTNSSQGGGGIYVHAWAHNLEISNNRVTNNQGTLAGGITVGQGEHPDAYLQGAVNPDPGSCVNNGVPANTQLPYCFDRFVNVHHNAVTTNSSEGDELFSATPSGAGGVAFCTGADNYQFNYNWVCGNMSTGDGAGVSHLGFAWDATIQHNAILFNQSTNPTTPSNGGGLLIMSAPDTDPICPGEPDIDCNHAFGTVGDGIGRNLTINANLIMGNAAEAGSGGGIRFQGVNGSEVSQFPTNPDRWYSVRVTNNIIADNVAGWDGAGISLQDSIGVNLINNTIVSNDTTASSGALFGAFFATQASAPTPCPPDFVNQNGGSGSCVPLSTPQPAGLSSASHTAEFMASLPATITCPAGHFSTASGGTATNGTCRTVSFPIIYNDVFWQNRAFHIEVTNPTANSGAQQATVRLAPAVNQSSTGQCVAPAAGTSFYWDIGLRGDTGPGDHSSGVTFTPQASVLTSTAGYTGGGTGFRGNTAFTTAGVVQQYCNGSRIPPEVPGAGGVWYQVPPGTNESNVPVPVFSLTAGATVDEGNNWVNINWGPLSLVNPSTKNELSDYSLAPGSNAIGYITNANSSTTYAAAPTNDYFEVARKTNGSVDIGAVEFNGPAAAVLSVTGGPLAFGNVATGTTSPARTLTLSNTGGAGATAIGLAFSDGHYSRSGGTCGTTLAAGANCTINVVFSPNATGTVNATLTITANVAVAGSPVSLSGTGVAPVIGASLTPTTWTVSQTRNCPGTGIAGILACSLDPVQVFTLTNTGNVTLTGITQASLGGTATNVANYTIVRALSTCGPTGNGQLTANTTLAAGANCVVTVQFKPLTAQSAGPKPATVSVTDSAGTQTSNLNGTAN